MRRARGLGGCLLLFVLASCDDAGAPAPSGSALDEERPSTGLLASPIGTRAYVALESATMPGADRVVVRAPGGDSARTLAVQGGFDPLAIAASEGQTVTVAVTDSAGRVTEASVKVTPRPPRVVRTSPAERRTDVPLNARVFVVFSVPMDPASVTGHVRLLRGDVPAAGRVELGADGTAAEFVPAEPLAALTEHTLAVDGEVTDVRGTPMGAPFSGTFQTGSTLGAVASMQLVIAGRACADAGVECRVSTQRSLGEALHAWYHLLDAEGQPVQGEYAVDLRSTNEAVLQEGVMRQPLMEWPGWSDATTQWNVRGFGSATLEARAAGVSAAIRLEVAPHVPIERLRSLAILERRSQYRASELWRVPLDGSAPLRLASSAELPPPPCGDGPCMDRVEFAIAKGGRVAMTRSGESAGIWVKDDASSAPRAIPVDATGAPRSPAWSPDGEWLAFWFDRGDVGDAQLRVVRADGSDARVLRVVSVEPGTGTPLHWHPDGRHLLLWDDAGTEAVPLDGGASWPYLVGYLAGPILADGHTQLMYSLGSFGPQEVPAYTWSLYDGAELRGSWQLRPGGTLLAVTPDAALVVYGDGVFTLDLQQVYDPQGEMLGFAP